jgi:hypothetical protein
MTITTEQTNTTNDNISLSGEQKALFDVMESTRQHMFITGRAGAGKSVLLRYFRENTKKRVMVAAPTGIAALNVKGQTIHSLFNLPFELYQPGKLQANPRLYTLLKRIDTLVIDEISMVRAELLDAIDERFRKACRTDEPFGGKQVIMFGDVYQLPPVVETKLVPYFERTYGGYYFFNAQVWKQTAFKIYELTQVFRQKDPVFKGILNAVRDGSVVESQLEQLNTRYGVSIPDDGKTITLAPTNNLVTNINQKRLRQLDGETYEYHATLLGKISDKDFPTEEIIELKVGAQVVLLQNDKDKRWVNGTVATVTALEKYDKKKKTEDKITVCVDGIDYTLEKATWEKIRYEYDHAEDEVKAEVVSSFTQFPIRLAWALTIHKSQGQTYESVALDLTTSTFAPGQMYVALSRATSLEGLYLKMPVKAKDIIVDPKVKEFMSKCEAIQVVEEVEYTEELAATLDMVPAPVEVVEVEAAPVVVEEEQEKKPVIEAPKKRGRKATGRIREKFQGTFDPKIIKFLDSMKKNKDGFDKSRFIEELIFASAEYQQFEDETPEPDNDPDGNGGGGAPTPEQEQEEVQTAAAEQSAPTWAGHDEAVDALYDASTQENAGVLTEWSSTLSTDETARIEPLTRKEKQGKKSTTDLKTISESGIVAISNLSRDVAVSPRQEWR